MPLKNLVIKQILFLFAIIFISLSVFCQSLAINTTGATANASAILDVSSANKGLLVPRISLVSISDVATILSPAAGLLVYNTNASITGSGANGAGFYYFDGAKWLKLIPLNSSGVTWLTTGNSGTIDGTNFIGTTDNVALNFKAFNEKAGRIDAINQNVFLGNLAGGSNSAQYNTAIGFWALKSNTSGSFNIALGNSSLYYNSTGAFNTATGVQSLYFNASGSNNTAYGANALFSNYSGVNNTGIGFGSLYTNDIGAGNTAIGFNTLNKNTTDENTAIGFNALNKNTTGANNTATGAESLQNNTIGFNNTSNGFSALSNNTTGRHNTGIGFKSLFTSTTGSFNTAVGTEALYTNNDDFNTAVGYQSLNKNTTGFNNTATGALALYANIGGRENTASGVGALRDNTTGQKNSALGNGALWNNVSGNVNSAFGNGALGSNVDGNNHTGIGVGALNRYNTNGTGNTAVGFGAFSNVLAGNYISSIGYNAAAAEGLINATAIGAFAKVDQSNSLVLGSTSGTNGATANTNVGIGTTTPNAPLQFGNWDNKRKIVLYDLNNNDNQFNGFGLDGIGVRYQVQNTAADHTFFSGATASSSNELMRITGSGKVGIGTPIPPNPLTINYTGTVAASTASYALAIQQAGSTDITLGSNSNAYLQTWNSKPLLINSQGNNVGIGLTTTPSAKLDVNGALLVESAQSTHAQGAWLEWNKDGGGGKSYLLNQKGLGSGGFVFGEVDNANAITQRFVIDNTGNASFFGTVSASCGTLICSDIRFKKDIEPLQNSLSKIIQLKGVSYYFKKEEFKDKNFNTNKQVGLIAQEVEKIYPELVQIDAQGYKSIDYAKLTPILVEAIKELQTQNNLLKNDNLLMKASVINIEVKLEKIEKIINTGINQ